MDRTSSGPLARPGQRQGPASSGNLGTTNAPAPHVTGSLPLSYYFTRVERPQSSTADRTRAQISPRPLEEPAHSSSESSAAAPTPSIGPLLPSSSPLDQLRQSVQLARAEVDLLPTGQELARGVVEDITGANPSRRETGPGARADMERVLRGARFALRSAVSFAERLEQVSANLPALRASLASPATATASGTSSIASPFDSRPFRRRRVHDSTLTSVTDNASSVHADQTPTQAESVVPDSVALASASRPFPGPDAALTRSLERSIATLRTAAARIDRLLEEFSSGAVNINESESIQERFGDQGRSIDSYAQEATMMERSVEERRQAWYARHQRGATARAAAGIRTGIEAGPAAELDHGSSIATTAGVRTVVHDPNGVELESDEVVQDARRGSFEGPDDRPLDSLLQTTDRSPISSATAGTAGRGTGRLASRRPDPSRQRSLETLSFPIKLDRNGVEIQDDEDRDFDFHSDWDSRCDWDRSDHDRNGLRRVDRYWASSDGSGSNSAEGSGDWELDTCVGWDGANETQRGTASVREGGRRGAMGRRPQRRYDICGR